MLCVAAALMMIMRVTQMMVTFCLKRATQARIIFLFLVGLFVVVVVTVTVPAAVDRCLHHLIQLDSLHLA